MELIKYAQKQRNQDSLAFGASKINIKQSSFFEFFKNIQNTIEYSFDYAKQCILR